MSDKTTTQVRVDNITYGKTKYIAERELRSINNQIEYFLMKGIQEYEKEHGVISPSILNVDLKEYLDTEE